MDNLDSLRMRLTKIAGVLSKLAEDGVLDQERKFRDEAKVRDQAITAAVMALGTTGNLAASMVKAFGHLKEVETLFQAVFDADKKLKTYADKPPKSQAYFPLHIKYDYPSTPDKPAGIKNKAAAKRVKSQIGEAKSDIAEVLGLHNDEVSSIVNAVSAALDAALPALPQK